MHEWILILIHSPLSTSNSSQIAPFLLLSPTRAAHIHVRMQGCLLHRQPRYRSSHSSRKLTLLPYCYQLPLASQIGVEPCESPPIAEYWAGLSCVGLVSAATVVESPWAQLPVVSRRHGSQQSSASSAELPEPCGKCVGGVPLGMSTPQSLTSALWSFGVHCVALWSMQKEVSLLRGEGGISLQL